MSLGTAIVKAFLSEHPFFFVTEGKIKSANKILKTCEIELTNNKDKKYKDVRWLSPIIPKKNEKCLLLFRDNLETRPTAFSFSAIDELQTTVGEFTDIEISDLQGVNLKHKNTEIKIGTTGNLTISNGSLEIEMNVLTQKFVIKGNVEYGTVGLEKSVLGETLKGKLDELIDAIKAITVTCTAPGSPSGVPLNSAAFDSIKSSLNEILTSKVKIS